MAEIVEQVQEREAAQVCSLPCPNNNRLLLLVLVVVVIVIILYSYNI